MKVLKQPIFWVWFFVALHALLFIYIDLVPFWDMPNHLAEATIYKFYNSESNVFNQYYELVPWYFPNLFHIWICNLPFIPDVESGNKLFFVIYFCLFPTSIYYVIKQLGGNTWYALLSFVYLYGYNVSFGFVGYTISIPVLFWLLYFILKDIETPKFAYKISQAVILINIYFMHAQSAMLGLLLLGLSYLYCHRKNLLALWPHIITTVPVVILLAIWWVSRKSGGSTVEHSEETINHFITKFFTEYYEKIGLPLMDNYVLFAGILGFIVSFLLFAAVFGPVLINLALVRKQAVKVLGSGPAVYVTLFAFILLLCYLLLPNDLPGQSPVSHRFGTILLLSFIVLGSLLLPTLKQDYLKNYVLVVVAIHFVLWGQYFIEFNQVNAGFNRKLFSKLDNTKRLSGIILNNNYRGRALYTHYQNYYITWQQGISSTMAIDFRFGLVRRKAPYTLLPKHYEWYKANESDQLFNQTLDSANYRIVDYLLTKGTSPKLTQYLSTHDELENKNDWRVFKNQQPLIVSSTSDTDSIQQSLEHIDTAHRP